MNYIVQVPTAKRICTMLHCMDLYTSMVEDVAILMLRHLDLVEEYIEHILHSEMCKHFGMEPCDNRLSELLDAETVAAAKRRCLQFYYEESSIDEFLESSEHTRYLQAYRRQHSRDPIGKCTTYSDSYLTYAFTPDYETGDLSWLK